MVTDYGIENEEQNSENTDQRASAVEEETTAENRITQCCMHELKYNTKEVFDDKTLGLNSS